MAQEQVSLGINLRQAKNNKNAATYGKYYPEVDMQKTLSLRGFAQHMTHHSSDYKRSTIEGVLFQICECLPELLAQGIPVKLGSLGTFYPTAEVKKGAGVADIASMEGLNPSDLIEAIHIRFLPDATKLDNLCGPAFKEACSLELRNIIDTTEVTIGGKPRKVQTLKPIATAVAELKAGSSGNNSGGGNQGGNSGGNNNTDPNTPTEDIPGEDRP